MSKSAAVLCTLALACAMLTGCGNDHATGIDVQRNLTYRTAHGPERMVLYEPSTSNTRPRPGIVFVHGGSWTGGSPAHMAKAARIAARQGYLGFDIGYQLRPPNVAREAADVRAAITDIRARAARFGLDPDRLSGLGGSAGAQLIMQAAIVDNAPLRAAVGWSGPYDLVAQLDARHRQLDDRHSATAARERLTRMMPHVLGCAPADCRAAAAEQSPARHVGRHEPPVLLFNSTHELMPTEQMHTFAGVLRAKGNRATTRTLPGNRHSARYTDDAIGPSLRFLDRV